MREVECIPAAREVVVVAGLVREKPIIRGVVDAAETQSRTEVIAFGGMVVDNVEDDFDAGVMQSRHGRSKCIERSIRGVTRIGREKAQRIVAPIVAEAALNQMSIIDKSVDRQQFKCGDA